MDCPPKKINRIKEEEEEDRISRLPDELIHLILSFIDHTEIAVRTCLLSTRWKNLWESLPHLNFESNGFYRGGKKFFKFVNRTISGRNHTSHVSTINFNSAWSIAPYLFKKIFKYAFSQGIQHLCIRDGGFRHKPFLIPISTFSSQSLKHLRLALSDETNLEIISPSPTQSLETLSGPRKTSIRATWNLPNLTNLYLDHVQLRLSSDSTAVKKGHKSVDIFSNLVHLKDLTLICCAILDLDALNIISVTLKHLNICTFDPYRRGPKACMYVVSTPNITSFKCEGDYELIISSTEQLSYLTEARIQLWNYRYKMPVERLLELFSLVRNAMVLTISAGAVEILSGAPELLGNRASQLGNLKCLTMGVLNESSAIANDVITYFLNSSPNASIETMSGSRRRTKLH